jgi:multiple sugar transport system substrate-binding protein
VRCGRYQPGACYTAAWNEVEAKHLTQAYSGEVDVDTAAKALAADMNALLAKK